MANFIGEYECKVDAKGRVMVPSGIRKQLDPAAQEKFVINRGFEKHLNLYPLNEWKIISADVNKLNLFVKKNRIFHRMFNNGATELALDNTSRILLPKKLMEYAGIKKDVVLFAYSNRIEVWATKEYKSMLSDESIDFGDLAEEVMGSDNSTNIQGGSSESEGTDVS